MRGARDGEHLVVRMDSALAPTLWAKPQHAPHPAAMDLIVSARGDAERRGVTVEFD